MVTILYSASQRGQLKMIVSDLLMLKENEDPCLRPNSNWRYVALREARPALSSSRPIPAF
jgi:hypothetical protein